MDNAWFRRSESRRKKRKFLTQITEISMWVVDTPWTLPGVESKKAEEKGKTFPTHFIEISNVGRRPSMDTAWSRR
jgi:hypothetical protein